MTPSLRLPLLALALAAPAVAPAAQAQVTPARRDTLPPLAPRDVEIRGQLRVRLPSIARQPLGGIAPVEPPRRLDPQRPVEAPVYATPPLPETPVARFDPPPLPDFTPGPALRVGMEGGVGRFLSRFGRFTAAGPVGRGTRAFLTGTYDGAEGERLDALARGYDDARGTLGLHYASARTSTEVEGSGLYRTLRTPTATAPDQLRTTGGGSGRLRVQTQTARGAAFEVGANMAVSSTDDDQPAAPGTFSDTHAGGVLRLDVPLGRVGAWASAQGALSTADALYDRTAFGVGAGVSGQSGRVAYRVGPRVLVYTTDSGAGGSRASETAVSADVDVRAVLSPQLTLRFTNAPEASIATAADLLAEAPYLSLSTRLMPEAVPVDARLAVETTRGAVSFAAWAGFRMAERQRYFVSTGRQLDVGYAAVSGAQAGVAVRYVTRSGLNASAELDYRSQSFEDQSGAQATVPYLAPVRGQVTVGYGLPHGGVVQASLVGEGARYAGLGETSRLGATVDLDLYAAVSVRGPLFVIVRADRLLATGRTRYLGHPETAGIVSGGIGIRW